MSGIVARTPMDHKPSPQADGVGDPPDAAVTLAPSPRPWRVKDHDILDATGAVVATVRTDALRGNIYARFDQAARNAEEIVRAVNRQEWS